MRLFLCSILITLFACSPGLVFADETKACHVVGSEINPTEARTTDNFINLLDGTTGTTQTGEDLFVAPAELHVSDIRAKTIDAPGAGDSWVVYFVADATRVPGVTCTISETGTTCDSGTGAGLVARGARLTLAVDSGEGGSDPSPTGSIEVSACIRRS